MDELHLPRVRPMAYDPRRPPVAPPPPAQANDGASHDDCTRPGLSLIDPACRRSSVRPRHRRTWSATFVHIAFLLIKVSVRRYDRAGFTAVTRQASKVRMQEQVGKTSRQKITSRGEETRNSKVNRTDRRWQSPRCRECVEGLPKRRRATRCPGGCSMPENVEALSACEASGGARPVR